MNPHETPTIRRNLPQAIAKYAAAQLAPAAAPAPAVLRAAPVAGAERGAPGGLVHRPADFQRAVRIQKSSGLHWQLGLDELIWVELRNLERFGNLL